MPLTGVPESRTRCLFAWISLVISLAEIAIVWGTTAFLYAHGPNTSVYRITGAAWIIGTVLSLASAILALLSRRHRRIGLIALIVAGISFFVCGLPMST